MTWTCFWDMHSGGNTKEPPYQMIYIEAPEDEARCVFYTRFGHDPRRVTRSCCGDDYSIDSHESLAQLTGYHRGCRALETPRRPNGLYANDDPVIQAHGYLEDGEEPPPGYTVEQNRLSRLPYQTLDAYLKNPDVFAIHAKDIRARERRVDIPESGYVWKDAAPKKKTPRKKIVIESPKKRRIDL